MFRSCDLDEWSQEQLDIMKISGNGNARAFFKSHGVTDDQMHVRRFSISIFLNYDILFSNSQTKSIRQRLLPNIKSI